MNYAIETMPWLPDAPLDYRDRCRSLDLSGDDLGERLVSLASHRLSSTQAIAFARAIRRARAERETIPGLSSFRLAVLPSFTMDTVADMLPAACARHLVDTSVSIAEYDQIVQTLYDPANEVLQPVPDAALLLFDHRWLGLDHFADGADPVDMAIERVTECLRLLRDNVGAQAIISTVAVPPGSLFGSLDRSVRGTMRSQIQRFNEALTTLAHQHNALLLDVAALAEQVGTARWFDPVAWSAFKLPFSTSCSAIFCDSLARLIASVRGKAHKCLVLDCDNTLWGGVIGDDGIENIVIGSGSGEGESFAAVHQLALDLKARGIILAVCSKNDDANARLPFAKHPDMLLRESDIAVFQANWTDKPTNIEAIARTLEIGLDSLVFLDDNSAERAQVRAALPMVAVPELPSDPALYAQILAMAGYFEATSFSDEDRQRNAGYQANAQRAEIREKSRDLGNYLRALDMVIDIKPFDAIGRQRIVQLINKSNQFNLTTRRYTDAEIVDVTDGSDIVTLQVRLADKFSDFGMIGVCIARPVEDGQTLDIDTWLMSCRVLGRRVEDAMLAALVECAIEAGKSRITARYLKTAKNAMVADLFDRLGFERVGESEGGDRSYQLTIANYERPDLPHRVAEDA